MKRLSLSLGWAFLIALSLFIAIVYSGCGSATKPETAKPTKQTDETDYSCIRIERVGAAEVIVCGSAQMCDHIHTRLVYFWDPLKSRYGLDGLSDCTPVTARFTSRP